MTKIIFKGYNLSYQLINQILLNKLVSMFNNPLENETYTDNLISNNTNILDTNVDIITPNNLDIDSISSVFDSLLTAKELGLITEK